jgi:hypothetical protein
MYWPDLSRLGDRNDLPPNYRAVGWLCRYFPFSKGPTSTVFRQRLQDLCWSPSRLTRGCHQCEFCSGQAAVGNGEIDVRGHDRKIYVAPAMVIHYVEAHEYCPPDVFIQAVERLPKHKWVNPVPELSDRVRAVSDSPSEENWGAFYAKFLRTKVGVSVAAGSASDLAKGRITRADLETKVILAELWPDGTPLLTITSDFENVPRDESICEHFAMLGCDVVRFAASKRACIWVNASPPGPPATVRIPKQEVARLCDQSQLD